MTTINPFTAYTPEQIAGLPEVGDVVREWEAVKRTLAEQWDTGNVGPIDVEVIADALAAEVERLRAMVAALESETAELRRLVERAQPIVEALGHEYGYDYADTWLTDADRILAPDTGEGE